MNDIIKDIQEKMKSRLEHMEEELSKVRTGRANPSMIEDIKVPVYGNEAPLNTVALITVPEARQLMVKPFDPSTLKDIEKGILDANLGFNPVNDGEILRITIPQLTEELRKQYAKDVKAIGENIKVSIRNIRRDGNDTVKKSDEFTDDERKHLEKEIQTLTDKSIKEIDVMVDEKEKEVMSV